MDNYAEKLEDTILNEEKEAKQDEKSSLFDNTQDNEVLEDGEWEEVSHEEFETSMEIDKMK